jgi:hypothetical protein
MRNSFLIVSLLLYLGMMLSSCKKTDPGPPTQVIDFESLPVPGAGYWNGSDLSGSFTGGIMEFENNYNPSWQTWAGFSYSQKSDVTTPGYTNEFSVFDPANHNNKFAVFYPDFGSDLFVSFPGNEEHTIESADLCNNTYAGLSMKNGDSYCKKFGGTTGTDPDWFKVTINGYNSNGTKVSSLDIYLADYRAKDPSKDYIVSKWTTFDFKPLGKVHKITFAFSSTDNGSFGINTPTYVCLDNIKYDSDGNTM